MIDKLIQIAIDGPVAAGKGTVARLVAERLGITYVDTGAMYRVAGLLADRAGIDLKEGDKIAQLIKKAKIQLRQPETEERDGRLITVIVDGEDVSWKIRTEKAGRSSSAVAKLAAVRKVLVEKQQEMAKTQSVVMEGRDITFRVLPESKLKIYLTASAEERATRRHKEQLMKGLDVTYQDILTDLIARDRQDMVIVLDQFKIVEGAWVLDTTGMSIEEVVDQIAQKAKEIYEN